MTVQEGRSIDVFVTDLRRRAAYCDFGAIKESLIRDQIVVGISDPKLRERLLRETDLTLEKAVKLCRITEQSKEQSKIFSSPPTKEGSIDTVKKIQLPVDTKKSKQEDSKKILKCKFCAMSHNRGNCPAYGATCLKCNGRNYYARCCLKPKNDTEERRVRHVQIELSEDKEPMEGLYIEEIQGSTRRNIQSDLLVAQKMVEKHFGDISGALPTFDDIIIGGKDEQEHDLILRKVLTRARERHIKFNRDKIQFRVSQVKYMGEVVSESGFSPDPEKISAIHNMPTPSCKQDLQRLLGMINYLAKYIPNMSELTAPLRSLLKSDVPWAWLPEHDTALTNLKSVLSSAPVLRFYDPSLPTTLQVDASKSGLGACLLQHNQPVAYASRAMSNSETNYAQIEKEFLAIVFGCERFNMYTYGAEIEVLTDHKSLESIFKKTLFKVPPRLQRMRLRLQKYNLKVRFVPEKFLYIADTLSRAFDQSNAPIDNDMHHDMEYLIHCVITNLPISDVKLMEL